MRTSGILLPITSLPSRYGIGCFSKEAYEFVDTMREAGQIYWQILPVGPTGYGDSPYQSFSTFAGNPYFVDLETLIKEELLTKEECEACDFGQEARYVDYGKVYSNRFALLKKAYERAEVEKDPEFSRFCDENKAWLEDFALYTAVKNYFGGRSWVEWDADIRLRTGAAMERFRELLREEILFGKFIQYCFYRQWKKLKNYANEKGLRIIGDLPIYVAFDSADAWAAPELFQFDEEGMPKAVAGCPPDAFAEDGQLWGNPLYDWPYHKKTGYEWWIRRIAHCMDFYDCIRIDHFRGFDEYYAIPYGDATARGGTWEPGPGYDFFAAVKEKLGEVNIIAEDLGFLTESVIRLVEDTGYPGMRILQFAFNGGMDNIYLPYNYARNVVAYTGTHDNDTLLGWCKKREGWEREFSDKYVGNGDRADIEKVWDYIRLTLLSVADTAIIPMQDYLCQDSEARLNAPSTLGRNWQWRMKEGEFTQQLAGKIRDMVTISGRV